MPSVTLSLLALHVSSVAVNVGTPPHAHLQGSAPPGPLMDSTPFFLAYPSESVCHCLLWLVPLHTAQHLHCNEACSANIVWDSNSIDKLIGSGTRRYDAIFAQCQSPYLLVSKLPKHFS